MCDSHKSRNAMQDALLLRFSLIGGMFDTIQRNTTLSTDWAILLVQLVIYGVIDLNNNSLVSLMFSFKEFICLIFITIILN